jgi:hypothetical protein
MLDGRGILETVPIGDGMQIGEKNFLSGKEETRRNTCRISRFFNAAGW